MTDEKQFKRGDKVIKHGQAFRIIGASNGVIRYKPYFSKPKNNGLVGSIPVESIKDNYIRKPVCKTKQYRLIKEILYTKGQKRKSNIAKLKTALEKNDFKKTLEVVKKIWWEKKDKTRTMAKNKERLLRSARQKCMEEMAVVRKISLKQAKEVIGRALKKAQENGK